MMGREGGAVSAPNVDSSSYHEQTLGPRGRDHYPVLQACSGNGSMGVNNGIKSWRGR